MSTHDPHGFITKYILSIVLETRYGGVSCPYPEFILARVEPIILSPLMWPVTALPGQRAVQPVIRKLLEAEVEVAIALQPGLNRSISAGSHL